MNRIVRVSHVAAYWRNDQPDGIGVMLPFDGDRGLRFCGELEQIADKWDLLGITPEGAIASLKKAIKRHDPIGVIVCVHWLQTRVHLVTDEYNGTLFMCQLDDGTALASERNPVTITDDNTHPVDVTSIIKAGRSADQKGVIEALRAVQDHARAEVKAREAKKGEQS